VQGTDSSWRRWKIRLWYLWKFYEIPCLMENTSLNFMCNHYRVHVAFVLLLQRLMCGPSWLPWAHGWFGTTVDRVHALYCRLCALGVYASRREEEGTEWSLGILRRGLASHFYSATRDELREDPRYAPEYPWFFTNICYFINNVYHRKGFEN
jgi:hypothetical protein